MARVIVTADDFGLCQEVNDAICLLHDRGVVHRQRAGEKPVSGNTMRMDRMA